MIEMSLKFTNLRLQSNLIGAIELIQDDPMALFVLALVAV